MIDINLLLIIVRLYAIIRITKRKEHCHARIRKRAYPFFTYTGPSDNNPWDEIDVEILGKDTTKVQFNYYTNGKGNHEFMYDLGFDASEDFHTYAFEWSENKITWYVDGQEAYSADKDIPVTEGKIMMNAWNGKNVDGWLKPFDDSTLPLSAEYQWIAFYSQNSQG